MTHWRTYAGLDDFLHRIRKGPKGEKIVGPSMDSKKVANNTYAIREGNRIHIKLHRTNVLTWHTPEEVSVDTSGWYTVTTKERINRFLPGGLVVTSDRGKWLVMYGKTSDNASWWNRSITPFYDGMCFYNTEQGWVPGDVVDIDVERELRLDREDAHNASMRRMIEKALKDLSLVQCPLCDNLPTIDPSLLKAHYAEHVVTGVITTGMAYQAFTRRGYVNGGVQFWAASTTNFGLTRTRRMIRALLHDYLLIGAVSTNRGRLPV